MKGGASKGIDEKYWEPWEVRRHRWDKRRTIAVTAIAVHRTIARSIVTRLRYRWLYFRYTR